MKTILKIIIFLVACVAIQSLRAQIEISGTIITTENSQAVITITHLSDGKMNTVDVNKRGKYAIPYLLQKGYDYAIRYTDLTVEKYVLIYAAAPEQFYPHGRLIIDVDLSTNTGEDTMIIYYDVSTHTYEIRPLTHLAEINKTSYHTIAIGAE